MKTAEICQDDSRREAVRATKLSALDYLEVSADQRVLTVTFLGKAPRSKGGGGKPVELIRRQNVRIEGGRRVRDVRVESVLVQRQRDPERDDTLEVRVDQPGDYSTYTLRLVNDPDRPDQDLLAGFDPRYTVLEFSFKAGCPSDLDCRAEAPCPPVPRVEPDIDYLAKDYASFRQLILDRLALLVPSWQETHVPDIGIALVEVLAYVGDYLGYYQDAVGTEAYLGTARQRISVGRHARLVDYQMHEGCNARAWVHVKTEAGDVPLQPSSFFFITGGVGSAESAAGPLTAAEVDKLPAADYEQFEPLVQDSRRPVTFREAYNTISFYTWGGVDCCLPRGATSATLRDTWIPASASTPGTTTPAHTATPGVKPPPPARLLDLRPGDVLVFEEVIGPKTGNPDDADPTRRHFVYLTQVTRIEDPLYRETLSGYHGDFPTPLVEIEWAAADALPFPFCLALLGPPPDCAYLVDVSVARGNVILVDHGRQIVPAEPLGPVPTDSSQVTCECQGRPSETLLTPARFRPVLPQAPVTFAEGWPGARSAGARLQQDPRRAVPRLSLLASLAGAPGETWLPSLDLLESGGDDRLFVTEIDDDGRAHLRFGDGQSGRMPEAGMTFAATYRIGLGPAGNVGAGTISRLVWRAGKLSGATLTPRNPLAATGGVAPEPVEEVKLFAPEAFRTVLQRAITADDYAAIVLRDFAATVQRAGAELRWMGSWYEAHVAIDPKGTESPVPKLLRQIERHLHRYQRLGHDVRVVQAQYVPIDLALTICVLPDYLRGHVEAALLEVFSSGLGAHGRPGFFHPDRLTFGEGLYLSRLVAAAQGVTGVASVRVTILQRLFEPARHEIARGVLPLGPLEVARLDNDPGAPGNGRLALNLQGGR